MWGLTATLLQPMRPMSLPNMFKFGVDIPAGAASLILPKNEKVVLFAATLVEETLNPVQVATSLFHTAIRDNEMELNSVEVEKENLLKGAKIIAYSGYFNDNEKPERIVDGDVDTKWCEVGSVLNYVDFDLGEAKTVSGWKLVNAGREDKGTLLPLASCKAETARLKNGRHLTI